jgi:two-component system nitrogen regulation response regulator GlnG
VRELRNFIYRLALLAREDIIDAAALTPLLTAPTREEVEAVPALPRASDLESCVTQWLAQENPEPGTVYDRALAAFERPLFIEILRATGGNQLRAAQLLGINRNTLRKRLGELNVDAETLGRRA